MTQPEFIAPPPTPAPAAAPQEPVQAQQGAAATEPPAPPWGSDAEFDPQKAWDLITKLREDNRNRTLSDTDRQKVEEYDRLQEAAKSDLQKANEATTRWQSEADAWRNAAVGSTVRALAAAEFADPDDAVNALDPKTYLDAGGQINEQAIKADLAKLLDAKPHYRRVDGSAPRVPAPNRAQGQQTPAASDPRDMFAGALQQAIGNN